MKNLFETAIFTGSCRTPQSKTFKTDPFKVGNCCRLHPNHKLADKHNLPSNKNLKEPKKPNVYVNPPAYELCLRLRHSTNGW